MKTTKGCGPHFGMISEKSFHTRRATVETKPTDKHVIITIESQQGNSRSFSACLLACSLSLSLSLSPRDRFLFVQLTRSTQLSYSVSFSRCLLKKCSRRIFVCVNELIQRFVSSSTFLTARLHPYIWFITVRIDQYG